MSQQKERFIVAAMHKWNRRVFDDLIRPLPGVWEFVDSRQGLVHALNGGPAPRYIFFLHWSWKVPDEITEGHECVAFHMTEVPYGRGGSPLQNLILRGHRETKLTALRMTADFDAGPVYIKLPLNLEGTAVEIYERASRLAVTGIKEIVEKRIQPVPQQGEPTVFRRRTPEESRVPPGLTKAQLYDFIRMLDAPGYPPAFIEHEGYRIELCSAKLKEDSLDAAAHVTLKGE